MTDTVWFAARRSVVQGYKPTRGVVISDLQDQRKSETGGERERTSRVASVTAPGEETCGYLVLKFGHLRDN